jgi:hypothetical protein
MPSPPRIRRGAAAAAEEENNGPALRPPPAIRRRNQAEWNEIFSREPDARGGPPGGSPGKNRHRGGRRKSRRGRSGSRRKSRRRPHRGGALYPNDDNTVITTRNGNDIDSVPTVRSYSAETDNPIASQNSSV